MKRIKIFMKIVNYNNLQVKANLNHAIASFFYKNMGDIAEEIHTSKEVKPFTFSKIIFNKFSFTENNKIKVLNENACLEFSSTNDEVINAILKNLKSAKFYNISNIVFSIKNIITYDNLYHGNVFHIRTDEPICVNTKTVNGNKTNEVFLSPNDTDFLNVIVNNINRKCLSSLTSEDIYVVPNTIKKKYIEYKPNAKVISYLCEFVIKCDEHIINKLFYNGIGVKNSCGFGKISIIKSE